MWAKLKKGVETIKVSGFRIPEDEWKKFRACSPALKPSKQLRLAIRQYIRGNAR
jgi:hypothetical protein